MGTMTLAAEAKSLAMTLVDGALKTIKNADELFDEARLLADAGHVARALLLHQISLEECGKAEMLYVALFELLSGNSVDMKELGKAFSKHAAKNRTNAYFLPMSDVEIAAREKNDTRAAASAFGELQDAFHKDSNDLKNASLYVDFTDIFVAPSEVITKEQLNAVFERNGQFMSMAMDKLGILGRWAVDLDAASIEVLNLRSTLGLDALDRSKPESIEEFQKRFEQMLGSLGNPTQPRGPST
jgi:AbiV family abortive infection protein